MLDLEQYLDMFLDESKEHLENLNQSLLELENDTSNMEIVNEIFRIAHTLKGMSSTMGFLKISNLTHKMENVLDDIRSGKLKIDSNIIDILFEGLDILEEFIKNVEIEGKESDRSVEDIIYRLEHIGSIEDSKVDKKDGNNEELEYVNDIISKANESGLNAYNIKIELDSNCMLKAARAFLVFKSVEEDGEIVHSNPSVEDIENENFDKEFDIIVLTKLQEEELREKLKNISEVKDVIIKDFEYQGNENIDENLNNEEFKYVYEVVTKAKEGGLNSYNIKIELDSNCMLKAARAFLVFKSVEEDGEIVYSNPSVEDIEDENFDKEFDIIVLTKLQEEELRDKLKNISEVKDVIIKDFTGDTPIRNNIDNKQSEDKVISKNEINKVVQGKIKNNKEKQNKQRRGKTGKTVRVDIDRLDNLMNLVSELIIVKTRLEDIDISSKTQNMNEAIEYLERITTSLHDAVTKVRMVPIERVFNRFPRMVRDLSKELNKEINLIMEGEETEVDRTVIDEIGDPLIHLLRNSIDHGIETPEVRRSLNKNEVGTVKLLAYPDGNNVVIEVCDDGAGINVEKIKNKAVEKGIISKEQAALMDDKEASNLIFAPGFSTADKISDISGRGVGLDVVKTKIEALGGLVEIETERNKGTKFIIRLPLTLAIIQALLVMVGSEKYAIPLNNIKEITNIDKNKIRKVEGKDIVLYRGKTLPLVDLGEVIEIDEKREKDLEEVTVVIVKKGDKDLGVIVDKLIGQQEIVIKSLGKYLSGINFIAGATILGNGSVALIIDTNSLF
ncbi:chemotaxis protein CheA [Tepidibacter thalassicus]|uniref:Chemotaxis protein CheA n=1 Tax=Tepidibacter thalassicus DSM 15285 TaxID=1123350 RepID=A0A1M5NU53_9FIRM|nr:chemotaxis protein CheA [Tepidibacter thalassicus]SHG93134.1 two-component system, chemotaxis family, sensor kinase CheA [Tepidibacter thalassicus DSM 15285]